MKEKHLYIKIYFFVIGISYLSVNVVHAQLSSDTANFSTTVSYPSNARKDSLFVFYSPGNTNKKGSLTASSLVACNFTWSKYNPAINSFDLPFKNQLSVTNSVVSNLDPGGYKVRVWNGLGIDTTYMAWVLIDTFKVSVLKDFQGKVLSSQFTCDYITVNGIIDSVKYSYYDTITNNTPVNLPGGYTFLWTSDNPDLIIPWPDTSLVSNRSFNPPYIDTWYILTAMDKFGLKLKDSVLYESIVVKPDFTIQVYDKEDTRDFIDPSIPIEGDAPFRVKFKNNSINGASYEWIFSNNISTGFFNEITQNLDYQPEFSYNIPDVYYPSIIVTSAAGCIDSFRLADSIIVKPSLLEVPNVFSPDGDSFNDYFKVNHQSIKEFKIWIFNRSGKVVYKAEINDLYEWEGWNGNVLNSGRPASPGPYYYVIEATGWDSEKYQKGQYAGVVYLFREGQ